MPGPVVNGVRQVGQPESTAPGQPGQVPHSQAFLPLESDGTMRLVLLSSGDVVIARLRDTTDRYGEPAFQLIRPYRVESAGQSAEISDAAPNWVLTPFLNGLSVQRNVVLFKTAVASVLEPDPALVRQYADLSAQQCPVEDTPVERLKKAFQDFTDSLEAS